MNPQDKNYFREMSRFQTPKQDGHYDDVYLELSSVCCRIRNTAKDLLEKDNSEERTHLKGLLEKFEELNNLKVK